MIRFVLKYLIKIYRSALSPWLGNNCHFRVSCSKNMILCLNQYGLILGFFYGASQIIKCHPWSFKNEVGYE